MSTGRPAGVCLSAGSFSINKAITFFKLQDNRQFTKVLVPINIPLRTRIQPADSIETHRTVK